MSVQQKKVRLFSFAFYTINRSLIQSSGQRLSDGKSSDDNDNEYESEEDSNPNTPGFSSSVCYEIYSFAANINVLIHQIQQLTITNAINTSKKVKTPLKRVHATVARIPQAKSHISANAFKVIPTQSPQERATDATFNTDEEPEAENDQNSGDVSASKSRKCSHTDKDLHSSSPVAHSSRR